MNYAGYSDGGFDHSNNNNNNSNSQFGNGFGGDSESNKPRWATQFISPVTIKMINESTFENGPDAAFFTHGVELSYVRFIGVLRGVEEQATHKMLTLEDGTGSIQVRLWNNERNEGDNVGDEYGDDFDGDEEDGVGADGEKFKLLQYLDIVATIKDFNQKAQIQVQSVSVIKDFNSVTYHMLNVAKNYLTTKNGIIGGTNVGNGAGSSVGESLFVDSNGDGDGDDANHKSGRGGVQTVPQKVIEFIQVQSKSMPDGVPVNFIASTLDMSVDDVQNAVAELHQEGLIFSTDDDDMYLPL